MELHKSVKSTYQETIIKETPGFRLTLKKHEVLSPKGTFSIEMFQETLHTDGHTLYTSTYNFFLDHADLQALAHGLTQ